MPAKAILANLEAPEFGYDHPWLDYSELPLSQELLPELLQLTSQRYDEELTPEDEPNKIHLHARRALCQLFPEEAVELLTRQMWSAPGYDSGFTQELPSCLARCAAVAIEPLRDILNSDLPSSAKHPIPESLEFIAKLNPKLNDQVLAIFSQYFAAPQRSHSLNALFIASAIELDRPEFIDPIRKLAEQDLIDLSLNGDLEDIEIKFGLRSERTTPRPTSFPDYLEIEEHERILTLKQQAPGTGSSPVEQLAYLHRGFVPASPLRDVCVFHGYLTALACNPDIEPYPEVAATVTGEHPTPKGFEQEAASLDGHIAAFFKEQAEGQFQGTFQPYIAVQYLENGEPAPNPAPWIIGFLSDFQHWNNPDHPVHREMHHELTLALSGEPDSIQHFDTFLDLLGRWFHELRKDEFEELDLQTGNPTTDALLRQHLNPTEKGEAPQ